MTVFLRLLAEPDKEKSLIETCTGFRKGTSHSRAFQLEPDSFRAVPGSPFSYWVSDDIRSYFEKSEMLFEHVGTASVGASTKDNFRYTRLWTEVSNENICGLRTATYEKTWVPFAMGGNDSPFYRDVGVVLNWKNDGFELKAAISEYRGSRGWGYQWSAALNGHDYYFNAGISWPKRAYRFAPQYMPAGCIFSDRGFGAFFVENQLLSKLAILNSSAFDYLFKVALGRFGYPEFLVGILNRVPVANIDSKIADVLEDLAIRAWASKRSLDSVDETSHAFVLPAALRTQIDDYNPHTIEMVLVQIQSEIDAIAFDLYGFSEDDRAAIQSGAAAGSEKDVKDGNDQNDDDSNDENGAAPIDDAAGLLSWAVGVAFGRFDWRLATAEREAPAEPEPFDPLPTKSPGMLPDGAEPFHSHAGILVDDEGHSHDLAYLLEEVLQRVEAPVQVDTRRWLQREFFPFHLQRYSKSRRKAPIYWPLSTLSGAYTLWLYYPDLTSQTLFTAVNDFIEPKLQQVRGDLDSLRGKGNARSKQEEKQLEVVSDLAQELADLRDALLAIAPKYSPNHDDGVQITAAPLWQLFRHKPWQKVLKDTWAKLENGDYDWAHLAYSYWPDRVREKCKTDKSLGIAHGLEDLYEEPAA